MNSKIQYITQLTKNDLDELKAVCNLTPGFGIKIEKEDGEVKISFNEDAFKLALNAFAKNGGLSCTQDEARLISFEI